MKKKNRITNDEDLNVAPAGSNALVVGSAMDLLKILKQREAKLKKRIINEQNEYKKLKYKSRRIRLTSPLNKRIGWFTDRMQELQLVILLIEKNISAKDFINEWNGDEKDVLVSGMVDSVVG